jgi:hypothetical protein
MVISLLGRMYDCAEDDLRDVDTAVESAGLLGRFGQVHRAMAHCMGGRLDDWRSTLEHHINAHPEDDTAKLVLGASLAMSGDASGCDWMERVLATCVNPVTRSAALEVMRLMRG